MLRLKTGTFWISVISVMELRWCVAYLSKNILISWYLAFLEVYLLGKVLKGERKATGYNFCNELKLKKEHKLRRIDWKKFVFQCKSNRKVREIAKLNICHFVSILFRSLPNKDYRGDRHLVTSKRSLSFLLCVLACVLCIGVLALQ